MAGPLLFDRVKETATTTGTGTFTLAGAVSNFRSFTSVLSDGDTTYYAIVHQSAAEWEVGLGTFTTSGTTLARTTVLSSSNSGSAVNFSSGTKDVFISIPASIVQGRSMIPIMASGMSPSVAGGCAALATVASASNQPDIQTLDFDATTEEYAQFSIPMPESWNEGTLTFMPIWSHASTTTNFGVVWSLQAVAVSNDDAIAVAFGTAVTSTDTGGTTNDLYVGPESSAMTVSGTPAAGDTVFFRIFRTPGNGSDTMAIDARLHGIRLYYTSVSGVDS